MPILRAAMYAHTWRSIACLPPMTGILAIDCASHRDGRSLLRVVGLPVVLVLLNNAGDAQAGDITNDSKWEYEYKNIFLSAVHMTQQFLLVQSSQLRGNT